MKGKLYLVSTPIGNLSDITLRAIDTLRQVDIIACEDTRKTKVLLSRYSISKRLLVYNDVNERKSTPGIIKLLKNNKDVALVSNSGTPLISDPGYRLVEECIKEEIKIIPVPGPTALITALSISGMPIDKFTFIGFLPKKKVRVRELFEKIRDAGFTTVIYESPHRLIKTLASIRDFFGNIQVTILRELSKIHEEAIRGSIEEVMEKIEEKGKIGEVVVILKPERGR